MNNDGCVARARDVRLVRWLGVGAPRGQRFKLPFVEAVSITEVPRSLDHSGNPVIGMSAALDPRVHGHGEHARAQCQWGA
jgi:hypothetical protein